MSAETEVGVALPTGVRLAGVLGVVEDQHVTGGRLGADDVRVLRHVPVK